MLVRFTLRCSPVVVTLSGPLSRERTLKPIFDYDAPANSLTVFRIGN